MSRWTLLDTAAVPGSRSQLHLYHRQLSGGGTAPLHHLPGAETALDHEEEFTIFVDREELMNSRASSSEDGFSQAGCARIRDRPAPRVLIGGLGMGYSLRSALDWLGSDATVVVAEIVPQVIAWNRYRLGHLAGHPLRDPRVSLREIDVARVLRAARAEFDLVMLDVDNGPEGLTRKANDWLYSEEGLLVARAALRPGGVLGFWSSGPDQTFVLRLEDAGYAVDELALPAADGCYGVEHTVWFAVPKLT